MPILVWVAVAVGAWCVASVITALALGAFLRRRGERSAARFEILRRLGTDPLRMWLAEMPDQRVPAAPAPLHDRELPRPRTAPDRVAPARREAETRG